MASNSGNNLKFKHYLSFNSYLMDILFDTKYLGYAKEMKINLTNIITIFCEIYLPSIY